MIVAKLTQNTGSPHDLRLRNFAQMTDVFKPQQKAILALLSALMCFSGRATMRNLRDMEQEAQSDSADGHPKSLAI